MPGAGESGGPAATAALRPPGSGCGGERGQQPTRLQRGTVWMLLPAFLLPDTSESKGWLGFKINWVSV